MTTLPALSEAETQKAQEAPSSEPSCDPSDGILRKPGFLVLIAARAQRSIQQPARSVKSKQGLNRTLAASQGFAGRRKVLLESCFWAGVTAAEGPGGPERIKENLAHDGKTSVGSDLSGGW